MSEVSPFMLNSISDMQLTADGQYLLIHGNQPTAAVHRSVLQDLLVALPNAIEHADRVAHNDREMGFALHCQGWEVGRLNGQETIVIRFRLSGTAGLSFSLPAGQIPYLLQALGGAAGINESHAEGVTLQ
ncbi:hypothetical protein SAMN05443245_1902 [Paraburkholderia fungorum]|uniref:Uncharacterized protein n=1 Tax=Paraburkholderia fungorum TaxID=134537 RepID=A0A1H1C1J5_9BURK|nr:hypothetical protein [Paraburkholderia fungorum]SDQ57526.1 hypothetical protein SAMN05443245_1902 [Paraburkholderia fungorum]